MTKKSFDILGDDQGSGDFSLSINSSYAKRYDERKRKQEMSELEDKYKAKLQKKGIFKDNNGNSGAGDEDNDSDYSDSESDEEEDDEGELLTPAVDAQILKTLSEIRSRSQKVYDPNTKFFDEQEIAKIDQEWRKKHSNSKSNSLKPDSKPKMTVRDYQRERILSGKALKEAEGDEEEEEEEEAEPLTHVQEQEILKAEMKKAFGSTNEEDGDDGLLSVRVKGEEEIAKEEEEYRNFLLENLASSENAKLSMGEWLSYREEQDGVNPRKGKSKKQLTDDDFLIDYVLNKGWVDKQASRIPSYDKVIEEDITEDEEAEEQAEEFELAHNFRYEQEGGTQIQTYSRTIEGSMRREEGNRKEQRKSAKDRKALEKLQKDEELKRLKNLKMAEIKKKLEKITSTSGNKIFTPIEEVADELEDDFDPEKHDKLMKKLICEDQNDAEDDKPVFSSDSEIDFTSDEEEKKPVIKKATKALKKAVKKLSKEEAGDEEAEKARLSKYLDELYNMDYEDLIGDIPCRFKYQRVEPSSYGLSIDEILAADDSQLNSYFSLKKMAPYLPAERQAHDIKKYTAKHRLHEFRKSLKESFKPKKSE